jgi:tRNA-Thr(GGU) m(6)t(6)A37 methyltransferase TsaA
MQLTYSPIGIIHSPFRHPEEMPIQPTSASSRPGTLEIYPEYAAGLQDLEGFSHIYLLYHFHKAGTAELLVTPFLDARPHGVFATRAPTRPNPIGLSLVKIARIEGNLVHIMALDILDETPLLDIKPYVPEFEQARAVRIGWLSKSRSRIRSAKADDRFRS